MYQLDMNSLDGKIKLEQITDGDDFWCLINELIDDKSGFMCNKSMIVEAYKHGNLYGLRMNETNLMYKNDARAHKIFCKDSFYLLPCFCIKDDQEAIILWVHTRARLNGFGKLLIQELGIKVTRNLLHDSIGFWEKLNITISGGK